MKKYMHTLEPRDKLKCNLQTLAYFRAAKGGELFKKDQEGWGKTSQEEGKWEE